MTWQNPDPRDRRPWSDDGADVVERALAVLEQNSREWTDRQEKTYPGVAGPDPGADDDL